MKEDRDQTSCSPHDADSYSPNNWDSTERRGHNGRRFAVSLVETCTSTFCSCCRGWGGFSPVPPSSQRLGFPWEAADWHPDCQPDDGSYQENQT
ncbi:uncharacterized protein LOC130177571 isoform X3 [Seriola aureovittata]|uniref:uncharacterized protein LOC130177571 isoform X3 n=1 Tax=Seriola aureovittata TaxID=2871759 RepID=UPI0024BE3119|nr:uncharacterized protein LOC130177571 isoform X3 [Seriola aureovittata]